jgi:uncharacterized protein YbaP (TraB family)
VLADALSHLPFDEEQKAYASPSHDKHNIQAITSSCQRVLNGDSVHVQPNQNSEDTNDIYHQLHDHLIYFNH